MHYYIDIITSFLKQVDRTWLEPGQHASQTETLTIMLFPRPSLMAFIEINAWQYGVAGYVFFSQGRNFKGFPPPKFLIQCPPNKIILWPICVNV